jgi:plastocyanin
VLYHTIVSRDDPPLFRGGTTGVGSSVFRFTFRRPGVFDYHCDYHPGAMDAILIVVAGS